MANIDKHVQHKKSRQTQKVDPNNQSSPEVLLYGLRKQPKLPKSGDLLNGEIAVNYGTGIETMSILSRNPYVETHPEIATFSSDRALHEVEEVVSAAIVELSEKIDAQQQIDVDDELSETSENPVQNKVITETIINNELVVSQSLNDLNDRKADKSALSDYLTAADAASLYATKADVEGKLDTSDLGTELSKYTTIAAHFTRGSLDGTWRYYNGAKSVADIIEGVAEQSTYTEFAESITQKTQGLDAIKPVVLDVVYNESGSLRSVDYIPFVGSMGNDSVLFTALGNSADVYADASDIVSVYYTLDTAQQVWQRHEYDFANRISELDSSVNSLDGTKADKSDVYDKGEIDAALAPIAASSIKSINGKEVEPTPVDGVHRILVDRTGSFTTADGTKTNFNYYNTEYGVAVASTDDTLGSNGLMSADDKTKLEGIEVGANNYVLPAATTSALGGVIAGGDLNIDASGNLSVDKETVLDDTTGTSTKPVTTKAVYDKFVEVDTTLGDKLDVDSPNVVTSVTNPTSSSPFPQTMSGEAVERRLNYQTADSDTHELTYWDTTYDLAVPSTTVGESMIVPGKHGLIRDTDQEKLNGIDVGANNYVLPSATTSALGGVIVGSDLSVDANGNLSVDKEAEISVDTGTSTKPVTTKAVYDKFVEVERVVAASDNELTTRLEALEAQLNALSETVESYRIALEGQVTLINQRIDTYHPQP